MKYTAREPRAKHGPNAGSVTINTDPFLVFHGERPSGPLSKVPIIADDVT